MEKQLHEERSSSNSANGEMSSILNHLVEIFSAAIRRTRTSFSNVEAIIAVSKGGSKFGDYQCNSALSLVRQLQEEGVKLSPRALAEEIVQHLESSPMVERVEVAGPGYINIFLAKYTKIFV